MAEGAVFLGCGGKEVSMLKEGFNSFGCTLDLNLKT